MVANQHHAIYRFVKVLLLLILLFTLLIAVGLIVPLEHSCKSGQSNPDFYSSKHLQDVASEDFTAIAQLRGYINYRDTTDYLPIYLSEVKYTREPSQYGGDHVELTLGSQCSELVVEIYVYDEVQRPENIALRRIYKHEDDLECSIEHLNFSTHPEFYYNCVNFSMNCQNDLSHQEANVHIDMLKFEINGRPDQIMQGLFRSGPEHLRTACFRNKRSTDELRVFSPHQIDSNHAAIMLDIDTEVSDKIFGRLTQLVDQRKICDEN